MMYTQGKTDCSPEQAGYDESRIEVLNNHLQGLINDGEIQCASYCVSRGGKVFMHGAVGPLSYKKEDQTPLTPEAVHYIASITKTFTAVAIMKLVEDGYTRLDVPVGEILPQFNTPPFNKINLFHLLTHTSGMHPDGGCFENKYEISSWGLIDLAYKLHKKEDGEFDWIAASLANGVRKEPGVEWMYCSFGFSILGAIIEKLTGIFAHNYIEDYIVKPLGMENSGFKMTADKAKRSILNDEHRERWLNSIITGKEEKDEGDEIWEKIPSTGGGMHSTPYDLIRYGNMMLNGGSFDGVRILGRKAVEKMTAKAIHNIPNYTWGGNEPERGYGVGFDRRFGPAFTFSEGTYMHEGAGACSLYIDPKEELVAAWIVPFAKEGWFPRALFNVQNIIWSGLK